MCAEIAYLAEAAACTNAVPGALNRLQQAELQLRLAALKWYAMVTQRQETCNRARLRNDCIDPLKWCQETWLRRTPGLVTMLPRAPKSEYTGRSSCAKYLTPLAPLYSAVAPAVVDAADPVSVLPLKYFVLLVHI
jgi:hypothetical protein